jgi:short-subunit dehydrogenase
MKNVALITGASSGIGRELAMIHASRGNDVVLVARRSNELNELKQFIEDQFHTEVLVIAIDLTEENTAQRIYDFLKEKEITIEYLINNAGVGGYGIFHERPMTNERKMIQLNVVALVELTHFILGDMVKNNRGRILNTASSAGFIPGPLQSVYFATKAFVVSFSQGIAQELKNTSITVTALCPGPVATGFEAAAGMEGSGLFENVASARSTAEKGYKAMMKGRLIEISDWKLNVALRFFLPFVPNKIVLKAVEKIQRIK